MKEKYLKALVHGGLAVLTLAEALTAKTRGRKLLLGAAAGWHCFSAFYHITLEEDKKDVKDLSKV